jgi:hypothetical protein
MVGMMVALLVVLKAVSMVAQLADETVAVLVD